MADNEPSDRDIEHLLCGGTPQSEELARLEPLFERLRGLGDHRPSAAHAADVVTHAAEIVRSTAPSLAAPVGAVATRPTLRRQPMRMKRRIAAGLTTLLLFFTMAGVAVASDWSAPGNALYGLDRAAERVGIGAGGLPERLDEALALAGGGRPAAALEHAADALANDDEGTGAADALLTAAAAVTSTDAGDADEVRQAVAEMLLWMSTTELTGMDFGLAVAAQAQQIASGVGSIEELPAPENLPGPPVSTPAGPPDELPEPPENLPGPPVSTPAGPPDELPEPPGGFPTLP